MDTIRQQLDRLRQDVDGLMARFAAGEPAHGNAGLTDHIINEACVRHLQATMDRESKTRGIGIFRVVVLLDGGHSATRSGMITSVDAEDFRKPTKLRPSLATLATDPLALRAVRMLAARFLEGEPMQMTKAELAAALGASESDLEEALSPLVADAMLDWKKDAAGEESYELHHDEPHVLLLQSLE